MLPPPCPPPWTSRKSRLILKRAVKLPLGALSFWLLLPSPVAASFASLQFIDAGTKTLSGYDEFIFLGWDRACSAAIQYFSYPPTGESLQGQPDTWSIGTLTIAPGASVVDKSWSYQGISQKAWDKSAAERSTAELLRASYKNAGHLERIRTAPVADRPGLSAVIHSTAAFTLGYAPQWPPERYKLYRVHYHPLGDCALILFRDILSPRDSYRYNLVRLQNPGARRTRARAHATNAIMLYQKSDIYAAEEELAIAVEMDPHYPLALYYHALLLANHGRFEDSLDRLQEAVRRNAKYREQARAAIEFESVRKTQRFREIIGRTGRPILKPEYEDDDFALPQPAER